MSLCFGGKKTSMTINNIKFYLYIYISNRMTASTDTQLKLQIQNRVNRLKNTPKFEITKKLKYAITFQFQILSRNILLINMQETVHNKGKVNTRLSSSCSTKNHM